MQSNIYIKVQKLQQQVSDNISKCKQILLAFSGGLDSTVLLDILVKLRDNKKKTTKDGMLPLSLRAIHIHHGINKNSNEWAKHCVTQCKLRNVPCNIIKIKLNDISSNIEENARLARYKALYDHLLIHEVLVTAHHLDDQVETLFLALKRGSGPTGLASMSININFHGYRLLRPLITCDRDSLKIYAIKYKLSWIEDDSNKNINYDRNFLRLCILPLLKQRWPYFSNTVARTAQLCAEQEMLLDELLSEVLKKLIKSDGSLDIIPLFKISAPQRNALIRRWLAINSIRMPSRKILEHIYKEIILSKHDSSPQLKLDNWLLRRFQNRLYLLPLCLSYSLNNIIIRWPVTNSLLLLPESLGILIRQQIATNSLCIIDKLSSVTQNSLALNISINNYSLINKLNMMSSYCIVIRAPLINELVSIKFNYTNNILLHIVGRHRGRKLKKLWQEFKIPPWLRKRIPLLFYNKTLIAALGVFITKEGQAQKQNSFWQLYWLYHVYYHPLSLINQSKK